MLSAILTVAALAALPYAPFNQDAPHPAFADLRSFEAAKERAGNDPAKLLKLSFWCEQRGMRAEQRAVLDQAVRLAPNNAMARGLLGQVSYQGRWETPEAVTKRMKEDEAHAAKLAEYNALRDRVDRDTEIERQTVDNFERSGFHAKAGEVKLRLERRLAPEQIRLGEWCEQNELKPEALAHFTSAVCLDPYNAAAWHHLGYVKHHGRWMNHEQIVAQEHEALAQKHADRHWEPLLRKWATELKSRTRREDAEKRLAEVTDARAVPSITRLLATSSPAYQALAVQLLGQIDAPSSSEELAAMTVYASEASVRLAAAQALKERSPRDYAGELVNRVHAPVQFEVQPLRGVGSEGCLVLDSPRFHVVRTYKAPMPFRLSSTFGGYAGYDANGLPMVLRRSDWREVERGKSVPNLIAKGEEAAAELIARANLNAEAARERLALDVNDVQTFNAESQVFNQRVAEALKVALDAPPGLGDDEDAWRTWYYDRIGYRYTPAPKVMVAENGTIDLPTPVIVSCFAAGTPVPTLEGTRPIETIRVGDQVLSQDVSTGGLAFRTVMAVHHNPPDQTVRVTLENGDAVVASRFHRFWIAGVGWAMARDLKAGDILRTLDGPSRIVSLDQAPVQPVFNLDVAQSRTYFVGKSEMLVHDNTLPPPHPVAPPFDRVVTTETKIH